MGSFFVPRIELNSVTRARHLLHGDAVDMSVGHSLTRACGDPLERVTHPGFVLEVKRHAPHIGLVGDVGRENLKHDGVADFFRDLHCLFRFCRLAGMGARNAVCSQQRFRSAFRKNRSLFGGDLVKLEADFFPVQWELNRNVLRSLIKTLKVAGIFHQRHESTNGLFRSRVRRDTKFIQDLNSLSHALPAQPCGKDRLGCGGGKLADSLGRRRWIRHSLRCEDDQDSINAGILQKDLDCFRDALGPGVAQHIDGISVRPGRREIFVEAGHALAGERGENSVRGDERIRRHNAGTAGIRDNPEARSDRNFLSSNQVGAVEDLADVHNPRHPDALECRFVYCVL